MIGFPKESHPGTHLGGQVRQLRAMKDQRAKIEHVAATSGDVLEAQIAKLRSVFPDVFVEGKIDFDKLRATLGAAAESGPGRFHFSWAGKDDAVSLLQTPSRGTLIHVQRSPSTLTPPETRSSKVTISKYSSSSSNRISGA